MEFVTSGRFGVDPGSVPGVLTARPVACGRRAPRVWTTRMALLAGTLAAGCWVSRTDDPDAGHDVAEDGPDGAEATGDEGPDDAVPDDVHGEEGGDGSDSCCTELGGPCNVVTQCGCPEGSMCILIQPPDSPIVEACVPTGTQPPGAPCSRDEDDCAAGSQCVWASGGELCHAFCYEDFDCPGPWDCGLSMRGVPGYELCSLAWSDPCDPFTGSWCPWGDACVIYFLPPPERSCAPAYGDAGYNCTPAGSTPPGGDCATEGCVVGSGCYRVGDGPATCFRYCAISGSGPGCDDLPGATCSSVVLHPTIGLCMAE